MKAFTLAGDEIYNRVRVEGDNIVSFAANCRHCAKPKCVEGCISGAMQRDPETGVVTSDPSRCVGCRTCVSMCPFGAITVVPAPSGVKPIALKCDLCGDGRAELRCGLPEPRAHVRGKRGDVAWRTIRVIT